MCFCATASFAAAGGLTLVGTALLLRKPPRSDLPIAFIPLGFAVQQSIEGLLWNTLQADGTYAMPLTLAFLFFAAFWWPFYFPLVAWRAESPANPIRRRILGTGTILGFITGVFLYVAYLRDPTPAAIVGDSISHTTPPWVPMQIGYAYVALTVGVGLITSRGILKIFCALSGIFLLIAGWLYPLTLTSVWCFFAAVLSTVLLCGRAPRAGATD